MRELICHMQSLCVANFVTLTWFQLKLKQMFASMKMRPPYFFIYDHLQWAFWGNIQILLGLAAGLTAQVLNFQKARQAKRAFWVLFNEFWLPRFHMNNARMAISSKQCKVISNGNVLLMKQSHDVHNEMLTPTPPPSTSISHILSLEVQIAPFSKSTLISSNRL